MRYIRNNKKHAFTLIELLVVVAIIGLLATLATISFSNSRTKARDAKRIADLRAVHTALRLYYDENGEYPHQTSYAVNSNANPTGWVPNIVADGYIAALPTDPLNTSGNTWLNNNYNYHYTSFSNDGYQSYNLITQLEDSNNPNRCELKCWQFHADTIGRVGQPWCGNASAICSGTITYSNRIYSPY